MSKPKYRKLKGDQNLVMGHLKWTITETATNQVIGQGDRRIVLGDLSVSEFDSRKSVVTAVALQLDSDFTISLCHSVEARSGFGFTASRRDVPTFGWDWFVVTGNHAVKLQEEGELALVWDETGILRTEFLTNVSLRVSNMQGTFNPLKPEWRVLIEKGSRMSWPT